MGQNGTQSTGGELLFNKVCGARNVPVTGGKENVGGMRKLSLVIEKWKPLHLMTFNFSLEYNTMSLVRMRRYREQELPGEKI